MGHRGHFTWDLEGGREVSPAFTSHAEAGAWLQLLHTDTNRPTPLEGSNNQARCCRVPSFSFSHSWQGASGSVRKGARCSCRSSTSLKLTCEQWETPVVPLHLCSPASQLQFVPTPCYLLSIFLPNCPSCWVKVAIASTEAITVHKLFCVISRLSEVKLLQ